MKPSSTKPEPLPALAVAAGSASVFEHLEAKLSPHAKHAFEAYQIGFWHGDATMTVRELRNAIRRIYGEAVDAELEQHFHDRREAVLPNASHQPCPVK